MAGGLRKAQNKAKAHQSWGLGFAELGNNNGYQLGLYLIEKKFKVSDEKILYTGYWFQSKTKRLTLVK